jgi:hypothetical protein
MIQLQKLIYDRERRVDKNLNDTVVPILWHNLKGLREITKKKSRLYFELGAFQI